MTYDIQTDAYSDTVAIDDDVQMYSSFKCNSVILYYVTACYSYFVVPLSAKLQKLNLDIELSYAVI